VTGVLSGIIVPLLTPLTPAGGIDGTALRKLIRHTIDGGVDVIFAGGSVGLGALLPDSQWRSMLEISRDEIGRKVPAIAGVMETSTPRAIERIKYLESIGFGFFVLTPTYYLTLHSAGEFLAHFGKCREASQMEMIVYNIPSCTGSCIPADTILEMARRGWTRMCKESSGDIAYFNDLCARAGDAGLTVYQGMRPDFASIGRQGAGGAVPVIANVLPAIAKQAWVNRSKANAAAFQREFDQAWDLLVRPYDYFSASLYALAKIGIGEGIMIKPFAALSKERKAEIDRYLSDIGFA
jgi:4-hydroxy-tetrahydrodipicolinate synthase